MLEEAISKWNPKSKREGDELGKGEREARALQVEAAADTKRPSSTDDPCT